VSGVIDLVNAADLDLDYEPVPADQVVAGSPRTGFAELGEFDGHAYGVWEMTPGAMSDVEEDEVFVVLFGEATVRLLDDDTTIELTAGSTVELLAGMKTVWTVAKTLRKVWFSAAEA
jgi:uncharacterized cupin superfamily protein